MMFSGYVLGTLIFFLGQLESSLTKSFIAASKLRRWLNRTDAPFFIKECKAVFDKAFGLTSKESAVLANPETLGGTDTLTPSDLYPLVKQDRVALRAHASYAGTNYSRSSTHVGNSLIIYWARGDVSGAPSVGSIKYIYNTADSVKLAVQRQVAAPDGTVNPFHPYPDYHAQIYSSQMSSVLEEVQFSWVVGHCARWHMSTELCVVLPLLRVSLERIIYHCEPRC